MIKLEYTNVMNIDGAMRAMRNPMNSHHKSDSVRCGDCRTCRLFDTGEQICLSDTQIGDFIVGDNDINLAQRLTKAGTEHRKYMRQIFVCVDITAPLYWWKEFDTYKVGTTANSTSTMHKIHSKPITRDDFSIDSGCIADEVFDKYIEAFEFMRIKFVETKDKAIWRSLIQMLPCGYNQTRTVTMSYENILNMYHQRKAHKLTEWHTFCDWALDLRYFKELGCIE